MMIHLGWSFREILFTSICIADVEVDIWGLRSGVVIAYSLIFGILMFISLIRWSFSLGHAITTFSIANGIGVSGIFLPLCIFFKFHPPPN